MSDAFTYETEVLPEIEIRELVSFEELLESMPSFVAFSQDEVFQHMSQLLQDKQRAAAFQDLFNRVRGSNMGKDVHAANVVPILKTQVSETGDEQTIDLVNALEKTNQAPNYQSQMEEMLKIMYPLENVPGPYITPIIPVTVGLENGTSKRFILLPSDKVSHDLYGAAYRRPNATPSSLLHERVNNTHEIAPFPSLDDVQEGKMPDELHVDFQDICNKLNTVVDVNTLNVYLESYGYSIDSLNEEECAVLVQRLQQLAVTNEEEQETSKISRDEPSRNALIPRKQLWEQFDTLLSAPLTIDKFRILWEGLAYSTQLVQPAVEVPINAIDIAKGLIENKFTLDEVIDNFKYKRRLSEYEQLRSALERFQAVSIEDSTALVEELKEKWQHIFKDYVDRAPKQFVTLYRDLAEIKEGRNDASYLGDVREYVFEEQANQTFANADMPDDDEEEDVSEVIESKKPEYDLKDATAGVREVLEVVLPKMDRLKISSGLPLNMDALVGSLTASITRMSRLEYLSQSIPTLSLQVKNQIVLMDMERALHMASFITPTELSAPLKEAIKHAWAALEEDIKSVFVEALAWWVLDLQEKAINRELIFDVTRGMMSCIRKWSPWGPPLQSDKGEGVLDYITCCAKETSDVWPWASDDLKRLVLDTVNENPKVEGMKARFKELGKAVLTMSEKAKAANISLGEVIENKQKNRYLPEYVKTYMLLPGLLAGHQPKMALGCCLQKLDENFEADSDWKGILKRLRDVKNAFSKKRSTMVEMPAYATFIPEDVPQEGSDINELTSSIHLNVGDMFKIDQWIKSWDEMNVSFVTRSMVEHVYSDANKALTQADKFIQFAINTSGIKQKHGSFITFLKESASWTQLNQTLNVISLCLQQQALTYNETSTERQVLHGAQSELVKVKRYMQKLTGILDEVEFALMKPLFIYVISRALCLPAYPETSTNQRLVLQTAVSSGFLSKTIKTVIEALRQMMNSSKMPTFEDQKQFITNMREKQKIEILDLLDKKTVDDRQILLDAKKLGIISLLQKPTDIDDTIEVTDEDVEQVGEAEFIARDQNGDQLDLDNLDDI